MKLRNVSSLTIAVSSGKIGYVYLCEGELFDWGLSSIAARSPEAAKAKVGSWIQTYNPDLIVTEKLTLQTRKSGRTISNLRIIAKLSDTSKAHHVEVEKIQTYPNKFKEADELCRRYPVIEGWKPHARKPWESEAKNTVIFEALALVDQLQI